VAFIVNQKHTTPSVVGVWHHLAITYKTTGPSVICYTNGFEDSDAGTNASGALVAGQPARFGGGFNASTAPFNGMIDDVRTYDRALVKSEIQELHAAPYAGLME